MFSSYKTNPVPGVLARLHGHGVGAEVISPYELWLAMRLGVPGERIIYNGPAKSPASIRAAIRHGALLVNANSVSEARLIARDRRRGAARRQPRAAHHRAGGVESPSSASPTSAPPPTPCAPPSTTRGSTCAACTSTAA